MENKDRDNRVDSLRYRGVIDRRRVGLDDGVLLSSVRHGYIAWKGGRPDRGGREIGWDDVLNLQIALHTSGSFDEFLDAT